MHKHSHGFFVTQQKFTSNLLSEFHCTSITPVVSPLEPHVKLAIDIGDPLSDPSVYGKLVGKLNFLQHTRLDLSLTVQHLSQFMLNPRVPYLEAGYHV